MRRNSVKGFVVLCAVVGAVAFSGQRALADEADECDANCATQYNACIAKAKEFVNDIEVQDASAACDKDLSACKADCMDKESNRRRFQHGE